MSNEFNEAKFKALNEAIFEAKRFIERAEKAIEADEQWYNSVHYASAKRSSMDLTRSLVAVRNGNRD